MDYLDKIELLAEGMNRKFSSHNDPFQIMTRLSEELGEVAMEINHHERTGTKVEKHGEPSKDSLASEIRDVMRCVASLAIHYDIKNEVRKSIDEQFEKLQATGFIKELE